MLAGVKQSPQSCWHRQLGDMLGPNCLSCEMAENDLHTGSENQKGYLFSPLKPFFPGTVACMLAAATC